jgi:hypothetical protein
MRCSRISWPGVARRFKASTVGKRAEQWCQRSLDRTRLRDTLPQVKALVTSESWFERTFWVTAWIALFAAIVIVEYLVGLPLTTPVLIATAIPIFALLELIRIYLLSHPRR